MKNKGITLIALVITIIVLLILAGVSIAMLTGENGILNQAKSAKEETEKAKVEEKEKLNQYENQILEYTSNLPKTEQTNPYLPSDKFKQVKESNLENGLVIQDEDGNSYVWIEVPKSIFITAKSDTAYTEIENDLKTYASDYRAQWEDTWHDGCGIENETEYNKLKNKMLQSVYQSGGFWISQYEIGTETVRKEAGNELSKPLSKEGMYPYNWVTCSQSQALASSLNSGSRTSSLLFGIQWDLVCKFIEVKGGKTKDELIVDSTSWGNYLNNTFEVTKGKYAYNYGEDYNEIVGSYTKETNKGALFTTGATDRNEVLNIYDLAGNLWEWTLENGDNELHPCAHRGGYFNNKGDVNPSSKHSREGISFSYGNVGFRATIY